MQLSRVKDEFLFTIESTGILSPEELFKEALKVLADCRCNPPNLQRQTPFFCTGADAEVRDCGGGAAGGGINS